MTCRLRRYILDQISVQRTLLHWMQIVTKKKQEVDQNECSLGGNRGVGKSWNASGWTPVAATIGPEWNKLEIS